jgi:maltose alpha-D-glucosyltransferase/alpha-amylase
MATNALTVQSGWKEIFEGSDAALRLEFAADILPGYLKKMRWFGAKSSKIKRYKIEHLLPFKISARDTVYMLFVEVVFQASNTETYFLPVALSKESVGETGTICEIIDKGGANKGYLVDAIYTEKFRTALFTHILGRKKVDLVTGQLRFSRGKILRGKMTGKEIQSRVLALEQSNSTILYQEKYFLKIYRKLFRNDNPDLELTRFLSEKTEFENSPSFAGGIEWVRADYYTVSLALMQEKVENQGEAWNDALDEIEEFFKRVEELSVKMEELPKIDLYRPIALHEVPEFYKKLAGEAMLEKVKKLAIRTAEMHVALFSDKTDRHFTSEAFTSDYTVWLLNRVMYMFDQRFNLLEQNIDKLKGQAREYAAYFIENKDLIKDKLLNFDEQNLNSCRIRIHGDYHLGQVLLTGDDFCILDFEGEPESTIRDRKVKQPPIKDLAGLFRSYHYAVFATLFQRLGGGDRAGFFTEVGGRYYRLLVAVSLHYYTKTAMDGGLNIGYAKEIDFLLRYHLFEKAIYELGYELHARPDWVIIPLKGIMQILKND